MSPLTWRRCHWRKGILIYSTSAVVMPRPSIVNILTYSKIPRWISHVSWDFANGTQTCMWGHFVITEWRSESEDVRLLRLLQQQKPEMMLKPTKHKLNQMVDDHLNIDIPGCCLAQKLLQRDKAFFLVQGILKTQCYIDMWLCDPKKCVLWDFFGAFYSKPAGIPGTPIFFKLISQQVTCNDQTRPSFHWAARSQALSRGFPVITWTMLAANHLSKRGHLCKCRYLSMI